MPEPWEIPPDEPRNRLALNLPQLMGPIANLRMPTPAPPASSPALLGSPSNSNLAVMPRPRTALADTAMPRPEHPANSVPMATDNPPSVTPSQGNPLAVTPMGEPARPGTDAYRLQQGRPELKGGKLALDIAGRILAPRIEASIPGTPGYYDALKGRTEAGQMEEAKIAEQRAKTEQEQSKAVQERAAAQKALTPPVQRPENLDQAEAQIFQDRVTAGDDPMTVLGDIYKAREAGKPAPKQGEQEQAISDYLAAKNLPNTPTNRNEARKQLKIQDQTPEKPQRVLLEVPQPDGSSKIIEATPGMTVPAGARTPTQAGNINQMEQTRADMAENVNENLNQLEKIVASRPDLFGKVKGRETKLRQWLGTNDPDIAAMKQISDNLGRAQTSAHGMRNGKLVEDAIVGILNGYKNGPDAIKRAIQSARDSVKTFTADVEVKGGKTGASAQTRDFGPAPSNKAEGDTGTLPDGTKVVVKNKRIVAQ